jgi:amidohydrolase
LIVSKETINIRQQFHKYPEISGQETETSQIVREELEKTRPDQLLAPLANTGLAAVYVGSQAGPSVLFRCELDALPIQEKNFFAHASQNPGISHVCGHDGHMAMLLALARWLGNNRPGRGKVILLFQPAEETGQGAMEVVLDKNFQTLKPDHVFALHNLPGFAKNAIVVRDGIFSAASAGMSIFLHGKTSHAAEPHQGFNPAYAIAGLIQQARAIEKSFTGFSDHVLITPVHARLGEIAFGTSAGEAELRFTLRAFDNHDMEQLKNHFTTIMKETCARENLSYHFQFEEVFPATENNPAMVDVIRKAALEHNLDIVETEAPFPWSEDFAHFTLGHPGALFGLGAGLQQPALHNPDYDFPDDILETGVNMYISILQQIFNKNKD